MRVFVRDIHEVGFIISSAIYSWFCFWLFSLNDSVGVQFQNVWANVWNQYSVCNHWNMLIIVKQLSPFFLFSSPLFLFFLHGSISSCLNKYINVPPVMKGYSSLVLGGKKFDNDPKLLVESHVCVSTCSQVIYNNF